MRHCHEEGLILVTSDRGRKSREILDLLKQVQVDVVYIPNGLSKSDLTKLVMKIWPSLEKKVTRRGARTKGGTIRYRCNATGHLKRCG